MRGTATHKPTPVQWVLWDGSNLDEVMNFCAESAVGGWAEWQSDRNGGKLVLHTMEGDRWVEIGDRITRGVEDELYFIKPSRWGKLFDDVVTF